MVVRILFWLIFLSQHAEFLSDGKSDNRADGPILIISLLHYGAVKRSWH